MGAENSRFAVIILTAGKSSRCDAEKASGRRLVGIEKKKPFYPLLGRGVWLYSLAVFARRSDVVQIILVVASSDRAEVEARYAREIASANVVVVEGGAERFLSVENALKRVDADVDYVAIHDGARPCLTDDAVDRAFQSAREYDSAVLAVPIVGSIKRGELTENGAVVTESVPRDGLWEAQTPQVFKRELIFKAYRDRSPDFSPTDDCGLVEALGVRPRLVLGDRFNLKITSETDFAFAENVLKSRERDGA